MSERQYNKEEVSEIFDRASQVERTGVPAAAEGLTLTALQEIGREVGISAESIALAARSLDQVGAPAEMKLAGLPVGVSRTVEFDRPLSDSDWEGLVADLRTTFQAKGVLRYDGPFRQWTNGNLRALVEPTKSGHRLRLQTFNGNARTMMIAGLGVLGGSFVTAIISGLTSGFSSSGGPNILISGALVGLAMAAIGALRIPGWARLRRSQFEALTARLADSAGKPETAQLKSGRIPDLG